MGDFKHLFIFSPGTWAGEGKIILNMLEDELTFKTSWGVQESDCTGKIQCMQGIQVQGLSEHVQNELCFYDFQQAGFSVAMDNPNVGRIVGAGIYDDKVIGWEFRNNGMNFEGVETYQLQEDGSYLMHGEYVTADQFRTQIEARLWQQSGEAPPMTEEEPNEGEGS